MRTNAIHAVIGASLFALLCCPLIARAGMEPATELPTRSRVLVTGDRIRLTPRDGSDRIVGMFQAASPDSLWFTAESGDRLGSRAVTWSSLRVAELSVGKRGHAVAGLFIGLAAGVGIGLLATSGGHERSGDPWGEIGGSIGDAVSDAIAVGLCGVGGMAAGAVIGGEFKSDRWERVLPPSAPEAAERAAAPDSVRTE